ncbi:hypothetical protein BB560_000283 [Smittium megazygosporum]|uniref:Flavin-nucleotide-binding protein n=1 Tax=Smittium megazygosporum TaxID=133381 RepID=A0A2T9ZKS4_9FUNG|nr:hypothetical protein BB560_000283 [Smittium megazygosporum]
MTDYTPTSKNINFVNRIRERAAYDQETIFKILDKGMIAHVGFHSAKNADEGEQWPFVIPMIYGRIDDTIYLHGYVSGRLMKSLANSVGPRTCITVTIIDGIVVSLTPFHNSNNYRSVCVFGHSREVTDPQEKLDALEAITNHQFKGGKNWDEGRPSNKTELNTTKVIAVKIETASAKQRTGWPKDEKEDIENKELTERTWTGVIPIKTVYGEPQPSPYSMKEIPEYLSSLYENN